MLIVHHMRTHTGIVQVAFNEQVGCIVSVMVCQATNKKSFSARFLERL